MSDVAITEALRAQTTGPLKLSAAQAVSPRAGLEEASNQFDSLRLSLQRGPQTTVPLVSSWLSNRAADSNPRIRHDPYKGWNINPFKGSILLCSLGVASFPEVAAACKRVSNLIALKMSIVFRVVFRKLLPTSCRCASRPSPAVPTSRKTFA